MTTTEIKERPILFSTPMVKAILEARKTVTRRIIKESFNGCLTNGGPHPCPNEPVVFYPGEIIEDLMTEGKTITVDYPQVRALFHCSTLDSEAKCPYGKPGDILWVRETFQIEKYFNGLRDECFPIYKADYDGPVAWDWKPSIFMPKEACRLRLEIVSIGVERLQDISVEDIIREGLQSNLREHDACCDLRDKWEALWTKINGAESWSANPWVWRIEFRKLNAM